VGCGDIFLIPDRDIYTVIKIRMQHYIRRYYGFIFFTAVFGIRLFECNMAVCANAYNKAAMRPLQDEEQQNNERNSFNA
jgi:hypothetical protein